MIGAHDPVPDIEIDPVIVAHFVVMHFMMGYSKAEFQ